MKRFLTFWLLATVAGLAAFATPMNDNRQLTSLWKKFEEARKADRPQKEAEILAQIKKEAATRHLAADFYDAATEYVRTVQRRDWKQRDQLYANLKAEVKAFAEPIVTFRWMKDWDNASPAALLAFVKENEAGLQGSHPYFYKGVSNFLNGALESFIRNDKEYALWTLLPYEEAQKALAPEIAGRYPNEAALEYYLLNSRYWPQEKEQEERAAFQAMADRYAGKAVALFPLSQVMRLRMAELERGKGTSAQFMALCEEAKAREKERKAYKGSEAVIVKGCSYYSDLIEQLESCDIDVSMKDGKIVVELQNLSKADVTLLEDKKKVQTWKLQNPVNSFYVVDTITIDLPKLPDNDYTVEAVSGRYSDETRYTQYTLSIATRADGDGRKVYVTDYKTGVPLRNVTLRLMKGDKEMAVSSLKLDGFTKLPSAFDQVIEQNPRTSFYLQAVDGDRKSRRVSTQGYSPSVTFNDQLRCNIFRDKGAYHPGETVRYKAVVFNGDPVRSLEVVSGKEVEVILHDSEDNILETQKLTTNDFGAVSGAFVLPTGIRNGRFEIEVKGLGYDWFRVDEFVLPSFDLSFDKVEKLYLMGDEVPVSGNVISYSGHSLKGMKLKVTIQRTWGDFREEKEVEVQEDNTFHFSFKADESGYYSVEVNAVDPSGETLAFSKNYYIGNTLSVKATVRNVADADLVLPDKNREIGFWRPWSPRYMIEGTRLQMELQALDGSGNAVPLPVRYKVMKADDTVVASGETPSARLLTVDLPGSGLFTVETEVSARSAAGEEVKATQTVRIFALSPQERHFTDDVTRFFLSGPSLVSDSIRARIGSAEGDAYAVVTVFGKNLEVLRDEQIRVVNGTVEDLTFTYLESWPDAVRVQVFYFLNGNSVCYDREYHREKDRYTLPLRFSRFQDKAFPGVTYSFTLETDKDVEVLAAAWDKSIDAIAENYWPQVNLRDVSVDRVYVSNTCGKVGGEEPVIAYGRMRSTKAGGAIMMKSARMDAAVNGVESIEDAVAEESVAFQLVEEKPSFGGYAEVNLRENFASALTFQPHLRPGDDGKLSFELQTSDKLSTFYVRAYAHDRQMRNAIVEGEMLVSLPVKLSLLEPKFLYVGDVYDAVVTVSSNAEEAVSGMMMIQVGDRGQEVPVTVGPKETISRTFRIVVDENVSEMLIKAAFKADDFSDGVQVKVPVFAAAQTLTEAHSAVLRAGEDREALLAELRSRFVNVPGSAALLKEITVLDMVKDAIPEHVNPKCNDVLSLSEAWYIRLMASRLGMKEGDSAELLEKILACRNGDGGFGWFEGMNSSPVITAVLLERLAKLRDRGFEIPDVSASVRYLDKVQFEELRPFYCGWLSDAQYMHIRAYYPEVPFQVKPSTESGRKRLKEFKKEAKSYLTPSAKEGRGLQGRILEKARRLITLRHLKATADGRALAKAWGISFSSKLDKSIRADVTSLLEYAVEHRDGGWYYPNAVLPWRGLMESEAYAHSLLCDLLKADDPVIADGIRLWLMLQKETQKWDTEPAYIDAVTSILDGSEAVLNTRVLALSATYKAPFKEIKAAGNGFSIARSFFRADGSEIHEGDSLKVGETVTVRYDIWNGENRSFVKVDAGREASLSPVQQLSGRLGYGFIRPFRNGVVFGFVPQGYRNVKAQRTEYYFDSYPEEKTSLSEDFFVTRAGVFHAPAVTIESLYAPHYRANTAGPAPLVSEQ